MFPSPRLIVVVFLVLLFTPAPGATFAQSDPFPPVPIAEIQGAGPVSPLSEKWVDAVGVVTGVTPDGFYLQDPVGDDDPQTSEGIFVYTRTAPPVRAGQCVRVRGAFVDEFYEKTELSRAKSVEQSNACPAQKVQPLPVPLTRLGSNPVDRFEPYEGMLVSVDDLTGIVQGPTKRFADGEAEIAFIPAQWAPHVEGGRVFQWQADAVPALMFVSSSLGATLPELNWGDRLALGPAPGADDAVIGVLDYNFGKYQLLPVPGAVVDVLPADDAKPAPVHEAAVPAPAGAASPAGAADFTVCSFNVLGMGRGTDQHPDPDDYNAQLYKRARAVAESLEGCTIIGLQETGALEDAQNLADLLAAEFGLEYTATAIAGPGTASVEFPLTNSVLARSDRVRIVAAELRQGCSRYNYDVRYMAGACPAGSYGLFNRPPLVVDLEVRGEWGAPVQLTLIDNHWKSKGGDETVNVVRRTDQARHVASLVQEKLDADPAAAVIVLGDLNDYYRSDPVEALRTGVTPPMVHTYDALRTLNRYTYIFNGGSQVLDHLLVTPSLAPQLAEVRPVRINADFAYPAAVNATVHHSSDHDPVLVRLRPGGAAWLGGQLGYAGIEVTVADASGANLATVTTDANGEFRVWNLTPGSVRVKLTPGNGVTVTEPDLEVELTTGGNWLPVPAIEHISVRHGVDVALETLRCLVSSDCLE